MLRGAPLLPAVRSALLPFAARWARQDEDLGAAAAGVRLMALCVAHGGGAAAAAEYAPVLMPPLLELVQAAAGGGAADVGAADGDTADGGAAEHAEACAYALGVLSEHGGRALDGPPPALGAVAAWLRATLQAPGARAPGACR
eukprot:1012029-Prymnesium_polylepis.1